MLRFSAVLSSPHPTPAWPPWRPRLLNLPLYKARPSCAPNKERKTRTNAGKVSPVSLDGLHTEHRSIPGKNLFSYQLRPATEAFRKTERREKPREKVRARERMWNVSHFHFSQRAVDGSAGRATVRPSWRPGLSPGSANDQL